MNITDEMLYQAAPEARDLWLSTLDAGTAQADDPLPPELENLFLQLNRRAQARRRFQRLLNGLKRTAAVIFIALGISFAGLLTVSAFRGEFFSLVTLVRENITTYYVDAVTDPDAAGYVYKTMPKVVLHYGPHYMTIRSQHTLDDGDRSFIRGQKIDPFPSSTFFDLEIHLIRSNSPYTVVYSTQGAEVQQLTINDWDVTACITEDLITLRWFEENLYFELFGRNIPLTELVKIAENVKIYP